MKWENLKRKWELCTSAILLAGGVASFMFLVQYTPKLLVDIYAHQDKQAAFILVGFAALVPLGILQWKHRFKLYPTLKKETR